MKLKKGFKKKRRITYRYLYFKFNVITQNMTKEDYERMYNDPDYKLFLKLKGDTKNKKY